MPGANQRKTQGRGWRLRRAALLLGCPGLILLSLAAPVGWVLLLGEPFQAGPYLLYGPGNISPVDPLRGHRDLFVGQAGYERRMWQSGEWMLFEVDRAM